MWGRKGFRLGSLAKKILKEKFVHKINFEKEFYPKIIKKYKCQMFHLDGIWYAMDNLKDVNAINKKNENIAMFKKITNVVRKLRR
tara:strand:+ start:73 stop:327 length:255 start_codon:yes stop_codon:yes gene_type:complete